MPATTLYENARHANILLEDFGHGDRWCRPTSTSSSTHGAGHAILDPGGHQGRTTSALSRRPTIPPRRKRTLRYIFLSHQDPDIVAAVNGWLMTTDADAYASRRSGSGSSLTSAIEDDAAWIDRSEADPGRRHGARTSVSAASSSILPAHFLHSCGNFQVYDPAWPKILYSGDLGALRWGWTTSTLQDFDRSPEAHGGISTNATWHRTARSKRGPDMVRGLDIDIIAPQHGAIFRSRELVNRFIAWCETLDCGVDLIADRLRVPSA